MPTTYLAPDPIQSTQFIPGSATPANGGQLFFYLAGTSTKETVYKDNAAGTSWSNPIVLDSGGNLPSGGEVWFTAGLSYKVVFAPSTDSDPPASPYWTKDNLSGINDVSATSSEWISGPTPTFVNATSFTLVGDQTSTFTVGRRIRTTNTGGTVYSTIVASSFGAVTTVTIVNDSGVLDSGLSAVAYSILGTSKTAVPLVAPYATPEVRGRLTLMPLQPITTSDVTNATSVMFTPYMGNTIDLYDGSASWRRFQFSEKAVTVPSSTTAYDVFAYLQTTGAISLSTVAWSTNSTRASALSTVAGAQTLAADATKLYLGSFFASTVSGTTTAQDTTVNRLLWNYWNRVDKPIVKALSTGTWTMVSSLAGTTRVANADSTNAISVMIGMSDVCVDLALKVTWNPLNNAQAGYSYQAGFGLNTVTSYAEPGFRGMGIISSSHNGQLMRMTQDARWAGYPGIGRNAFYWLEDMDSGSGSVSVYGSSYIARSGISGTFLG